jgi:hypothetical protein
MPDGGALCWTHFRVVAKRELTDQQRLEWVDLALDRGYTASRLRNEIAAAQESESSLAFRRLLQRLCALAKDSAVLEAKLEFLGQIVPDLDPELMIESYLALDAAQRQISASQHVAEMLRGILRRHVSPTDGGSENVYLNAIQGAPA